MKKVTALMCAFTLAAPLAANAAWEKVPLPEGIYGSIGFMEFANPNLGFASIYDENKPLNFLVYKNGSWYLTALPGMWLGYATDISVLSSGYAWVGGRHFGMNRWLYTARSWGGGVWEKVPNPYEGGNFPEFSALSFGGEENGWLRFRDDRFLKYVDGSWTEVPDPLPPQLGTTSDIFFVSADEGWASGKYGFAHYKNGEWEYVPGPSASGLVFTAADDGWATVFEAGQVLHYDGSSWRVVFTLPGWWTYYATFCDRNNGWAVFGNGNDPTRLFKFESGSWREVKPPQPEGVGEPCSVSPTEAWFIGGEANKTWMWHWTTEPQVEETSLGKTKAIYK